MDGQMDGGRESWILHLHIWFLIFPRFLFGFTQLCPFVFLLLAFHRNLGSKVTFASVCLPLSMQVVFWGLHFTASSSYKTWLPLLNLGFLPLQSSHAPLSSSKRGGRMKNSSTDDPIEKPFHCELCGTRYKSRTGLTYHYTHYHRSVRYSVGPLVFNRYIGLFC